MTTGTPSRAFISRTRLGGTGAAPVPQIRSTPRSASSNSGRSRRSRHCDGTPWPTETRSAAIWASTASAFHGVAGTIVVITYSISSIRCVVYRDIGERRRRDPPVERRSEWSHADRDGRQVPVVEDSALRIAGRPARPDDRNRPGRVRRRGGRLGGRACATIGARPGRTTAVSDAIGFGKAPSVSGRAAPPGGLPGTGRSAHEESGPTTTRGRLRRRMLVTSVGPSRGLIPDVIAPSRIAAW